MFWSSPAFDPSKDMIDLNGKVAIVTGSNTGLGYGILKGLARGGAKVYMAARTEAKATAAITALEADGIEPGSVVWLKLDLSDLDGAKKAAEEFMSRESRLDILVNNAALLVKLEQAMINGVPEAMVTNHLGHFVFTTTLLPVLIKTATEVDSDVRILNVASNGHLYVPPVQFKTIDDLKLEYQSGPVPGLVRYAHSKLANVLFTNELQRRFTAANTPILVMSLHPGLVFTFGQYLPLRPIVEPIARLLLPSPDSAAASPLFAVASPIPRKEIEKYKACFFVPVCQIGKKAKQAESEELGKDLWVVTERALKENFELEIDTTL